MQSEAVLSAGLTANNDEKQEPIDRSYFHFYRGS